MKRYLELFFSHPIRFSLPIIVALLAGAAYGTKLPPSYMASTTIFCDASLPNTSTLQNPVQSGGTTPAQDKQATLLEFLASPSFVNKMAMRATHTKQIDDLAADAIAKTIKVTVPGPNILQVEVKTTSPTQAVATASAVVAEFISELQTVLQQRSQGLIDAYKSVDNTSSATLASAESALNAYVQAHGVSTTDPQEVQLTNNVTQASQANAAAEDNLNQALLSQATGIDPADFHEIDPPQLPTAPASAKKQLLLVVVGGLLGGVVVTIIALVLAMAFDRTVKDETDLESMQVVAIVPQLGPGVLSVKGRRGRKAKKRADKQAEGRAREQAKNEAKREKEAKSQAEEKAKQDAKKAKKGAGSPVEPVAAAVEPAEHPVGASSSVTGEASSEAAVEPSEKVPAPAEAGLPDEPRLGMRLPSELVEPCRTALRHLKLLDGARSRVDHPNGSALVLAERPPSIGLTSCIRGEGRSTVAAGLAAAIHKAYGSRVILVELDLAQPSLGQHFGLESAPGVAEILRDGKSIEECLHMPDDGSPGILVAGDAKGDPDGLSVTLRGGTLMEDLVRLCDVVVADLPPVFSGGHAADLAPLCGSVVMVVRTGAVPPSEVRRAADDLGAVPPVILNGVESSLPPRLRALFAG